MLSIFKIFIIFGIISKWAEKALEDQVITLDEAAKLVEELAPVLGITVNLDLSKIAILTPDENAEIPDDIKELPHKTEA